jgi:hypothetical protein
MNRAKITCDHCDTFFINLEDERNGVFYNHLLDSVNKMTSHSSACKFSGTAIFNIEIWEE